PLPPPRNTPADPGATPEKTPSVPPHIELARLSIVNGTLMLETEKGTTVRADGFNVSITNLRPGAEAAVKLDAALESRAPDLAGNVALATKARLKGTLLELRQASLSATPLRGPLPQALGPVRALLDATWDIATGHMEVPSLKLTTNGLDATFSGSARPAAASLQGRLDIDAAPRVLAKLFGAAFPASGGKDVLTLHARLLLEDERLLLSALRGALDDTSIKGDLTLGLGGAPSVRGVVEIGDIPLDAWLETDATNVASGSESRGAASEAVVHPAPGRRDGEVSPADAPRHFSSSGMPRSTPAYPALNVDVRVASVTFSAMRLVGVRARLLGEGGRYAA
ncbi:MAG: hypothetical protein K2O70_08840, partial [Desulfovibrionaceae bacterium]|nr:hypothetical protein [Desulfovibrionaceae bacterium]